MPPPDVVPRLAEVAVTIGANLQPGQILTILAETGQEELVRAVAVEAYRRGARFVDPLYFDPHVKRARIEHADGDTLEFVPSWHGARVLERGRQRCAHVSVAGAVEPDVFEGLDPARLGRDLLPRIEESTRVIGERTSNWTIVPYATPGWARQVHPELDEAGALERLWEELAHVCRIDADDPVAAWQRRLDATGAAAGRLNERAFDALHNEGPGTDLTVGLLPSSHWANASFVTVDGIRHLANIPTEEVFTSPDPERAEGVVRATKPLVFSDGSRVDGLTVRLAGGRAVASEPTRAPRTSARAARGTRAAGASARSPSSTVRVASGRSAPSSTTRSWTRTRPATSPSGPDSPSPWASWTGRA